MYGFIYVTTNYVNGKKYIGQKKYDKRGNWKEYLGSGIILTRAIDKYGKENFSKEIIEECKSKEELNEREKYWISYYDAVNSKMFYNIASGGDGGNTLSGYTEEQMIAHNLKQSRSKKGIINQGKNNPNAKQVICLNNMKIFDTTIEAANYANTHDYMIQSCCNEKSQSKTAGYDPVTHERLQWAYYYKNKIYSFIPHKRDTTNTNRKVKCEELNMTFDSIRAAAKYVDRAENTLWSHLNGFTKFCGKHLMEKVTLEIYSIVFMDM